MRTLFVLAAVACFATTAWARIWTTVYRHDGKTPLAAVDPNHPTTYRDVMAGTHLVIVVSSDEGGYRWDALLLPWEDVGRASLTGRGLRALPLGYPDSCLPAAGTDAEAIPFMGMPDLGVEFISTYYSPVPDFARSVPGDWFVFDYHATRSGPCRIELHDLDYYARQADPFAWVELRDLIESFDAPLQVHSFMHVPTRDFNADDIVDLHDFALLASQWRSAPAPDPNDPDVTPDLDGGGMVEANDLALFTDFWLERTDTEAISDPNAA